MISAIDPEGSKIVDERPSGPDAEHRRPSKTINAKAQQIMRAKRRQKWTADKYDEAVLKYNTIHEMLKRNKAI